MVAVANKQQFKIKVYKKQIEEAGDIIAFILAKFREAEQELEEANKQQFRKERDNKGGTRRSMAIFALNTLTNWQQLRETVGNVSAEGIRPFLYCLALVCDKRMTFLKIVKVCHRPVSKRSRVGQEAHSHFLFTIVLIP